MERAKKKKKLKASPKHLGLLYYVHDMHINLYEDVNYNFLPSLGSYCLIWTSSTQSAGNQPVLPLTVPSQKPPSPILSTDADRKKGKLLLITQKTMFMWYHCETVEAVECFKITKSHTRTKSRAYFIQNTSECAKTMGKTTRKKVFVLKLQTWYRWKGWKIQA